MKKRSGRGGARLGAGRPAGSVELLRRNRIVLMVTDGELAKLERLARDRKIPLGTAAYEIVERTLRRRK